MVDNNLDLEGSEGCLVKLCYVGDMFGKLCSDQGIMVVEFGIM